MNKDKLIEQLKDGLLESHDDDISLVHLNVRGETHLNVEIPEPTGTFIEVWLDNKAFSFKADLTEEQIMKIFKIPSRRNTFIDSNGLLEFHDNARGMIINTDIKVAEPLEGCRDIVVK